MSMLILKVKAVIFDMDGVITNTMPDHFASWDQVLCKRGIQVTHLDIYQREGQPGIDSVREIFAKYSRPCRESQAKRILKEKEEVFKHIVKTRFVRGARRFIGQLVNGRFCLALVTGTSAHEMKMILPQYIRDKFSAIVTGDQVDNGKPHPEPFLLSLKRLSVAAREAVVIENAPFGILSARRAGLNCLALATSLPEHYLKGATAVYRDYRDLQRKTSFKLLNGKI